MAVKIEDPVYRDSTDSEREHEAFGQILVTHRSGTSRLYGSDLEHMHTIGITVVESKEHRSLNQTRYFGGKVILGLQMSEAQFVEMVARPGHGSGVPCTILYRHTEGFKEMADLPPADREADKISAEFRANAKRVGANLAVLERGLAALMQAKGSPTKAELKKLSDALRQAQMAISDSMPFIEESFVEAMETTVSRARVEMEAHAAGIVRNLGLDVLDSAKRIARGDTPEPQKAVEDKSAHDPS